MISEVPLWRCFGLSAWSSSMNPIQRKQLQDTSSSTPTKYRCFCMQSFFFIRTIKFWAEAGCSYKYFEDFAPNVFKTSSTIEVSIGCAVVIFHSHKPTGSTNQPEVQTNRKYKPTGSTNQPEVQTNRKHK